MRKVIFKGTETEHVIYSPPGTAQSVERALEARGYTASLGQDGSPWREDASRTEMFAVRGKLNGADSGALLFLADTEEAVDAAWEAIFLYFPGCYSEKLEKLTRPA